MPCTAVQLDRSWKCRRTGQPYYGEAIAPSNLSYYERLAGYGKVCPPVIALQLLAAGWLEPRGWSRSALFLLPSQQAACMCPCICLQPRSAVQQVPA